eukprot:GABW01001584.1.p1 GENE.GABW01001584.1~~GABW01001584.1.p1  ORF type:complete len:102 (-),score=8.09 GABW01001584.1:15-320(-)
MALADIKQATDPVTGAQITVCADHGLEYCPRCCLDLRDMNEDAKNEAVRKLCSASGCHKKASHRCGKCMIAKYCSRECQAKDWKRHKSKCRTEEEDTITDP